MERADLFGSGKTPPALVAPKFKVSYRYFCLDSGCPGHTGQILDWELTELMRKYRHASEDELKTAVRTNFFDRMMGADRDPSLYLGNFEAATKRHNFSVLGVYYPFRNASNLALF